MAIHEPEREPAPEPASDPAPDPTPERRASGRRGLLTGLAGLAAGAALGAGKPPAPAPPGLVFIGAYTSVRGGGAGSGTGTGAGPGVGIGLASYDRRTGRMTAAGVIEGVPDPSYLALHPRGHTLYAVNEQQNGTVTAVRLADRRILGTRTTGGALPCHVSVHPSGRWLLTANYFSGSVAVHPIDATGGLAEPSDVVPHLVPPPGPGQESAHAHQIITSPDGRFVLAVDLGNDTVYTYRLDPTAGRLKRIAHVSLAPGAGPRHLTFHPRGKFAYLANELDNTVVVCAYDPATGDLSPGPARPTGSGTGGTRNYPAQILVGKSGRFAYLANRGHNSIARYAVEASGARLRLLNTVPVRGDFPRHIAFSPDERLLFAANQRSGSVTVFRADPGSGRLTLSGVSYTAPGAACTLVRF
ncbi:lactonase family protein [Streptomyces sp. VNUA116]|uniref:lactonase family protein n=1 Tax=Streptomyces sp. VNUA116 TaxID=3062449 RepID=UPI002674F244|nr:lactonase family protein [Streptomyces sp. VNUA116]WKU46106.1 lactonase family protein [Streptomyces sp. VNUA116]